MIMDFDKYFEKAELIPAIIQEKATGEVLMLAYMNRESMEKKSCGTRALPRVISKRWSTFTPTATTTPCL